MLGSGLAMRSGIAAGMRRMGVSPSMGFWPGTSSENGGFAWNRGKMVVAIASRCRDYAGLSGKELFRGPTDSCVGNVDDEGLEEPLGGGRSSFFNVREDCQC